MATKVFISSVSRGLEEIRQQVAMFINSLGHEASMFEFDFFTKTQYQSMLETCLKQVENSHIYVLIIGEHIGTVVEELGKSITHLEFRKAISTNKTIIVFVEEYIQQVYFKEFRRIFVRKIEENHELGKATRFEEVYSELTNHSISEGVFRIVHDAYQYVPWLFPFKTAEDINRVLKHELSAMLSYFIELRNNKQLASIDKIIAASSRVSQYDQFLKDIFPLIEHFKIEDYNELLRKAQPNLKGGVIYHHEGAGILLPILEIGNCEGISLYHFTDNEKLIRFAHSGLAKGREEYHIDDAESYVATTFRLYQRNENDNMMQQIFQENNTLYICQVIGNFVLTLHFPIEHYLVHYDSISNYTQTIFTGIMELKANGKIVEFLTTVLSERGEGNAN